MFRRRAHLREGATRRLIGLALLVSMCASILPFFVVDRVSGEKDLSAPFPCQNRPCGCLSAEQCWRECCCFTNAQKVAWARKNRVTPPQYVVEAARSEAQPKQVAVSPSTRAAGATCRSTSHGCTGKSCCESGRQSTCSACATSAREQREKPLAGRSKRFVIGIERMKCRGQGPGWNSLPWADLPVAEEPCIAGSLPRWDHPSSVIAAFIADDPPEPPPRLA